MENLLIQLYRASIVSFWQQLQVATILMQHLNIGGQHTDPMLRLSDDGLEKKLTAPLSVVVALFTVILLMLSFTVILLLAFLLQLLLTSL
jgi:hypothetical protein